MPSKANGVYIVKTRGVFFVQITEAPPIFLTYFLVGNPKLFFGWGKLDISRFSFVVFFVRRNDKNIFPLFYEIPPATWTTRVDPNFLSMFGTGSS